MSGRFEELNKNINIVTMTMLTSQNLCKYLSDNSTTPLLSSDILDTTTLMFNNIFPTPITPLPSDKNKSLITIVLDDFSLNRDHVSFKTSKIIFNIICHIDLWKIDGGIRPYAIMSEIDKLFGMQRVVGIGRTLFDRSRWISINEKFQGYQLSYSIEDLNING